MVHTVVTGVNMDLTRAIVVSLSQSGVEIIVVIVRIVGPEIVLVV